MEDNKDFLLAFEEKKETGTLKVLTVLTFIGCGVALILSIVGFVFAKIGFEIADKYINQGNPDNLPSSVGDTYTPETLELLRKSYEFRMPIFLIGLLATGLCLFGAIKMRKLKADGYWIWLIGEILPYLVGLFYVGTMAFAKPIALISLLIPITFIALYTFQRKHLS